MNKYTLHQVLASVWVALFIINVALILLPFQRFVFERCAKDYESRVEVPEQMDTETSDNEPIVDLGTDTDVKEYTGAVMSGFEKELQYRYLSKAFRQFFSNKYPLQGYSVSDTNVERLNDLKYYYRRAWIVAICMLGLMIYSFRILAVRRLYMPFVYGGVLAAFFTSLNAFIIMRSGKNVLVGIRNMILYEDYGYFKSGDIVSRIFPPEFARWLSIYYLGLVFVLILVMVFVRWYIMFRGRPHKF